MENKVKKGLLHCFIYKRCEYSDNECPYIGTRNCISNLGLDALIALTHNVNGGKHYVKANRQRQLSGLRGHRQNRVHDD